MTRRLLLVLLLLVPGSLPAQQQRAPESGWSALRISKWASLAATLGTAVYGVSTIRTADDDYERLERACQAVPLTCRRREPGGAYTDAGLERQYQAVLRRDRRARTALLASQVGVAATVALFILDLRNARGPGDIPYHPKGLEVLPRSDGVELRLTLPAH